MKAGIWILCLALAAGPARSADVEIKFTNYKLENGLTVILSEDHRLPQIAVDVRYGVGHGNEEPGQVRFSGLVRRLMLAGTKHIADQKALLQSMNGGAGAAWGSDALDDGTNFHELIPSNELAAALWLESDRMAFSVDFLDQARLAAQIDVMEKEQGTGTRLGVLAWHVCQELYPAPHTYNSCGTGSFDELRKASVAQVQAFFRAWYGPENASLALVGDFDSAAARELIERWFGPVARGELHPRAEHPQAELTQVTKRMDTDREATRRKLAVVWRGVRRFSAEEPAGDMLARVLMYRLYVSGRQSPQPGVRYEAFDIGQAQGGYFYVQAELDAEGDAPAALSVIQAEIDRVRAAPPSTQELVRVKQLAILQAGFVLETSTARAHSLNLCFITSGSADCNRRVAEAWRAVTPEEVTRFAKAHLSDDKRVELNILYPTPRPPEGKP